MTFPTPEQLALAPKTLREALERIVAYILPTDSSTCYYTHPLTNRCCAIGQFFPRELRDDLILRELNGNTIYKLAREYLEEKLIFEMTAMTVAQCGAIQNMFDESPSAVKRVIQKILDGETTDIKDVYFHLG